MAELVPIISVRKANVMYDEGGVGSRPTSNVTFAENVI
jgi:hypothetical protein